LGGEAALLRASQKIRKEMDRAWKDFFDRIVPLDPALRAGSFKRIRTRKRRASGDGLRSG